MYGVINKVLSHFKSASSLKVRPFVVIFSEDSLHLAASGAEKYMRDNAPV